MKNLIDQKLNDIQICNFIILFLYFLPFLTKQMRIGILSLLDLLLWLVCCLFISMWGENKWVNTNLRAKAEDARFRIHGAKTFLNSYRWPRPQTETEVVSEVCRFSSRNLRSLYEFSGQYKLWSWRALSDHNVIYNKYSFEVP